jgi:hypothetical protein
MQEMQRRSLLQLAPAARPSPLGAQSVSATRAVTPVRVAARTDREGKKHKNGVSSTTYFKVPTEDTAGTRCVLGQLNQKKAGPRRHFHHTEGTLFYVLEGESVVGAGAESFSLKAVYRARGPQRIPHAWAFVGGSGGRLLMSCLPAGKMEAIFNDWETRGLQPGVQQSTPNDNALMPAFGMERVAPSMKLDRGF